jgi:hypothetical protein
MLSVTFEGDIQIHNGDKIEILRGIRTGDTIRASQVRNITQGGWTKRSHIDGVLMTVQVTDFHPPILGKVENLRFPSSKAVEFTLTEGRFVDNHVFVEAGNLSKARSIIGQILKEELRDYVKICDPYVNRETFSLLRDVPSSVDILVLYDQAGKGAKESDIQECVDNLTREGKTIIVKSCKGSLHARYILTRGACWSLGHSLHDAGTKDTPIDKVMDPAAIAEYEKAFDGHWTSV